MNPFIEAPAEEKVPVPPLIQIDKKYVPFLYFGLGFALIIFIAGEAIIRGWIR